uniref:GIY-YIG domain-containing protein n=1 Tax=Candidatus Kentrum sp. DK TaxID=2126562 RepID=A0A450T4H8_9GAMM|nr:MAG: hypothetical protein BECKDK2373C_GA0170839_108715 [Candidatus Kentron sp. DK]
MALYPLIGSSRIWKEEFIRERISRLPVLNWELLGKLVTTNVEVIPNCPGIYLFVRKSALDDISPFSNPLYPAIVYVGRSRELKRRLMDYVKDKRAVKSYRTFNRKIRDSIKLMFKEFDDGLDVYYSICSPDDLVIAEDILIKILDPVFNAEQKLKEDDFLSYGKEFDSRIGKSDDAYSTNDRKDNNQ